MRRHGAEPASYPLHGNREEVNFGGTGSYAGLLNLLATAVGQINAGVPTAIEGQHTQVFSATVEPLRLVKHLTEEDESNLHHHPVMEHLEVFITEAGLPIKVVQTIDSADVHQTTTTQVLAVNVPIKVKEPPRANDRAGRGASSFYANSREHKTGTIFGTNKEVFVAITASEARRGLFPLIERVNDDRAAIEITSKRGNAVLMSADEYAAWQETAYLFRSPANARRLLDAAAAAQRGETAEHPLDRE